MGAAVGNVPQLLQSTASSSATRSVPELSQSPASSSAAGREPHDSIGSVRSDQASFPIESEPNSARLNNYQNLFDSYGAAIDLITWARAHTTYPGVSAWLEACGQWDAAVVSKEHLIHTKRRSLCKKHGIPFTKVIATNATVEAAMDQVRRKLLQQIQEIRSKRQMPQMFGLLQSSPPPSTASIHPLLQSAGSVPPPMKAKHRRDNKLDNYFTPRAAGDAHPEIEELRISDMATSPHHSRAKGWIGSSGNCPTNLNLPGQLPDEPGFAPNFKVVFGRN